MRQLNCSSRSKVGWRSPLSNNGWHHMQLLCRATKEQECSVQFTACMHARRTKGECSVQWLVSAVGGAPALCSLLQTSSARPTVNIAPPHHRHCSHCSRIVMNDVQLLSVKQPRPCRQTAFKPLMAASTNNVVNHQVKISWYIDAFATTLLNERNIAIKCHFFLFSVKYMLNVSWKTNVAYSVQIPVNIVLAHQSHVERRQNVLIWGRWRQLFTTKIQAKCNYR